MVAVKTSGSVSATRVVAGTFGVLVGLAGIEHGYFEILQGDVRPESLMIEAIGPAQRYWEYGTQHALTVIPSFLVSGILAMIIGLIVVVWSVGFIHRKHGAWVFLFLSIMLFLVGGGFAPIFLAILAGITATRIDKPLLWWRAHLPIRLRVMLAKLWPWPLVILVLIYVIAVEIAIFGYPLVGFLGADNTFAIQYTAAYIMLGLMLLSVLTGFGYDIQKRSYATVP